MSVVSVRARSFILALFIRDDGERFLLGDRGFDFKDSQLHFSANTIENDEVEKQGVDGVMLAGQVRRASVQSFDGYVGDGTTLKEEVEQMRRDFIAFFAKGHHFRVIYIDCNRNAWQRKGGYLVDAPEVKELWQIHPEYHVGLNFEDVNYYEYDENADGEEILSNIISVPISSDVEGGLVWDENGAVSEPEEIEYDTETATASGTNISIADAVEAPLKSLEIQGNTSQTGTPTPDAPVAVQTVTGENVVKICGKNLFDKDKALDNYFYTSTGSKSTYSKAQFYNNEFVPTSNKITMSFSAAHDKQSGSSIEANVRIVQYDASGNFISRLMSRTNGYTFTLDANTKSFILCVDNGPDAWFDDLQVEYGSTATAYEPYQGQSYEVNLGKNLFDKDTATLGYRIGSDGSLFADGSYFVSDYIQVSPNSKYEISPAGTTSDYGSSATAYYDSSKTFISRVMGVSSGWQHISTPANCAYIRFTTNKIVIDSTQLEKGSTPTSYAAYFEPIELCKIGTYQDYIYKSGDKWYVRKETNKVNLDGSTEGTWWYANEHGHERFIVTYPDIATQSPYAASTPKIQFSNHFEGSNGYHTYTGDMNNIMSGHHSSRQIIIRSTQFTSLAAFTSWLGTNKPSMYYVKATPTDTEITNEALVAQLEAILDGGTSAGTNNITTIISAGNAQGELEITYYTKYDAKVVGGYVWEAGGSGGPTIVMNESISAVSPVWTVFGPALNPMLENTTTGEQIQYVGMISEGQTLVVDMGEQTASLDGLNVISNIVGEYLTLAPGSNTLLFSADSDAPASEIGWSEIVG